VTNPVPRTTHRFFVVGFLSLLTTCILTRRAEAQRFHAPIPAPRLVGEKVSTALSILGTPRDLLKGRDATAVCAGKCDEVWLYGDVEADECSRDGAVIFVEQGKIIQARLIYTGCPGPITEDFPLLTSFHPSSGVEEVEHHGTFPIKGTSGSDFLFRNLQWTAKGTRYTALVVCPAQRYYNKGELLFRAATRAEYRLSVLTEALVPVIPTDEHGYLEMVIGLLSQNYQLPIGVSQFSNPPEIVFHIAPDGALSGIKLTKSSGNSFADVACVDAAKQTGKLPAPPQSLHGMRVQCQK